MRKAGSLGKEASHRQDNSVGRAERAMISITTRAAEMLGEKLIQIYIKAGGLDMVCITPEAAKILKKKLVDSCFEAGIGFRMFVEGEHHGEKTFSIKVDKERSGDEVLEADGVRVFIDPTSATQVADHELDYIGEPENGFVLR